MLAASCFLAVVAGVMAYVQWIYLGVAEKRDTELAQVTGSQFRFARVAYGATAVLAIISAATGSSLAFLLAIVGLAAAALSRPVFGHRRRNLGRS